MQLCKQLKRRYWDNIQLHNDRDIVYGHFDLPQGYVLLYKGRPVVVTKGKDVPTKDDPLAQFVYAKPLNPLTEFWAKWGQDWALAGQKYAIWKPLRALRNAGYLDAPEGVWPGYRALLRTFTLDPKVRAERIDRRTGFSKRVKYFSELNQKLIHDLEHGRPTPKPGVTAVYTKEWTDDAPVA